MGAHPLAPAHRRRRPGFINEHQSRRIEVDLSIEPGLPPRLYVGTVLLGRVCGPFLLRLYRRKNRHSVA